MVTTKKVGSIESAESPYPWYDLEIRDNAPYIVTDKDGGTSVDLSDSAHSVPSFSSLPEPAASVMSSDAVYAVTDGGDYIAYEPGTELSDQDVSLRAHLASYDSASDEFTLLEFVER